MTPAELEERKKGIGGSEIAAILGLDRFSGPLDVYLSKVGDWTRAPSPDLERGTFLEQGIIDWYAHRVGGEIVRGRAVTHPIDSHLRCTPDAFDVSVPAIANCDAGRLVSIKSPRRGGETPDGHVLQLQYEDAICAAIGSRFVPTHHLVALIDGDLRITEVERDLDLQEELLSFADAWWRKHVVARVPPPLDGSDGASRWIRERFPRDMSPIRKATLDESVRLHRLRGAEETLAAAEAEYEVARQFVEESIGEAGGLECEAVGRVTWRVTKAGKRSFLTKWGVK